MRHWRATRAYEILKMNRVRSTISTNPVGLAVPQNEHFIERR